MTSSPRSRPDGWSRYVTDLGLELQRRRHDAGLSQQALADLAGITRYRYGLLEAGGKDGEDVNPSLLVLVRIANALGVVVGDLLPDHRHLEG